MRSARDWGAWVAGAVVTVIALQSGAMAKTVTITYSTWAVKTETDELTRNIFPRFEAENPGIKVKLLITGDYITKMLSMMAAGIAPDLMQVEEPMMDYFYQSGQLTDLTSYVKGDKLKLKDYVDIMDGRAYWESRPIGLPYHAVTTGMYYNKNLLAQAGLTAPERAWDWVSFTDMAKKLTTDTNGDGKPEVYGTQLDTWECIWGPYMWSNGGYVYDSQMLAKKVTVASPQAIQALQFMQDMLFKNRVAKLGSGVGDFIRGKVAMVYEGSWNVPDLRAQIKGFDWDVQLLPRSPYTKRPSARIAMGAASIWKGSKHKAEAWKLLKFLVTSEYAQRRKAQTALYAPLTVEQTKWPEYFPTTLKPASGNAVFYDSLKDAEIQTVYPTTKSADLVQGAINRVFNNKSSAEEAWKALQQPLEAEMAKALARRSK